MAIFRPIRASEDTITSMGYNEGYLYFAKDSGKIFLDVDNQRKTMGGSGVSVFYARDINVIENAATGYFSISASSLMDESASPKEEDLILNIPDGGFYRVMQNDGYTLTCTRIAVSGSGSGGGGGGSEGGGGSTGAYVTLTPLSGSPPLIYVYGRSYKMKFMATSTVDDYCYIQLEVLQSDGTRVYTSRQRVKSGGTAELDFGAALPKGSDYTILVTAISDNVSSTDYRRYTGLSTLELGIAKNPDFNPYQVFSASNPCSFGYTVKGSSGIVRRVEVYIDGSLFTTDTISENVGDNTKRTVALPSVGADGSQLISHGAHTVSAKLLTTINDEEIETDSINYELAWAQDGLNDAIIWCPYGYPETIVQYENLNIEYLVYQPGVTSALEVQFLKSGELLMTRSVTYSASSSNIWNVTDYEVGENNYAIACGNAKKSFLITVTADTSRDLGIITSGLVLNLDSTGRSNSEYPSSRNVWKSTNTASTGDVQLNNFNWYNNGWITDSDGASFLRVSNGASVRIPLKALNIMNSRNIDTPVSIEFRFRVRNITKYDTLIKTEDKNGVPVQSVTGTEAWAKYYSAAGFCLGTQEAFIKSDKTIASAKYMDDEIVTVSMVIDQKSESYPLLYVYINGILTSISKYDKNSESFNAETEYLDIVSDYCDVDIFKIRVYRGNKLAPDNVVQNYIADLKDVNAYDVNQITDNNSDQIPVISYEKLINYNKEHPDATTIPYMVIESSDHVLPYVKGGKKIVNIDFVNPALDYAYEQGLIDDETYIKGAPSFSYTQDFSSGKGSLDVQGTSSQGYPRRNYKWKAKQKDATWVYSGGPLKGEPIYQYDAEASAAKGKDVYVGSSLNGVEYKKYRLDSDIGESTFCFKADYMESSGTYNTGFASFVKTTYDKHPLNDYGVSTSVTNSYRTTVYGFPILVFSKNSDGSIEFIGRYNFNLDKSSNATYGFEDGHDSFVKDEDGNALSFEEVAECWEFCNNQGDYCSFVLNDFETLAEVSYEQIALTEGTWEPGKYYIKTTDAIAAKDIYTLAEGDFNPNDVYYREIQGTLAVMDAFEYRYSYYADDIDDCVDGVGDFAGLDQNTRNAFLLDKLRNLREVYTWLNSTYKGGVTNEPLPEPIVYNGMKYDTDTVEYRSAKFLAEFKEHFDLDYCTNYAIMTEFFHLYDSRGKNMMLATWGPQKEGGNYIWYPIFYDIDTQLGINNSGVPTWGYDAEPTSNSQFSTSNSVLWNNFYDSFYDNITSNYDSLRKNNKLNITQVNAYYNSYPIPAFPEYDSWKDILNDSNPEARRKEIISYGRIGKKPIMMINVDEYFKYIAPSISGYTNTSGENVKDTGAYFYALQGTRELSRYLYLRNRFNFVDSLWRAGEYSYNVMVNKLHFRANANMGDSSSDHFLLVDKTHSAGEILETENGTKYKYLEESPSLDADFDFNGIRTFLTSYVTPFWDAIPQTTVKCDGVNAVNAPALDTNGKLDSMKSSPGFSQQLFYLGGPEYIADLGDLSVKYIDEFFGNDLTRLESLKMGSDEIYNDVDLGKIVYSNSMLTKFNVCPTAGLLKSVLLNGVNSISENVDFSGCEKLEELRALRTNFTGFNFADGVQLKTLHLPESVQGLTLTEPTSLTTILTEAYDDPENLTGPKEGLYIEGLTNKTSIAADDVTHINDFSVIGGSFGYGSYELLEKLVAIKNAMINSGNTPSGYKNTLEIKLTDVEWSPYKQVIYGEPYESSKVYWVDNQHFGFALYEGGASEWEFNTSNGYIYEYQDEEKSNIITDLSLLKTFIDDNNKRLAGAQNSNNFRDTSGYSDTMPEITGIIYVENIDKLTEAEIANTYLANFPNLKIFAKNVEQSYSSQFVTLINGVETEIYAERFDIPSDGSTIHVCYPSIEPSRFNYVFQGWALDPSDLDNGGNVMSKEDIEALEFSDSTKTYKFYAVWFIKSWTINYNVISKDNTVEGHLMSQMTNAGEYINPPLIIPVSPSETSLELTRRYGFVGWTTDKKNCYPANTAEAEKVVVDVSKIVSENTDRTFYAVFVEESVYDSTLGAEYFTVLGLQEDGSINPAYLKEKEVSFINGSINITIPAGGVTLTLKYSADEVPLAGKITLPTTFTIQGVTYPVYEVTGFYGQKNITHIFWEQNNRNLRRIYKSGAGLSEGAFADCTSLVYFEMPDTLEIIETYSFSGSGLDLNLTDLSQATALKQIGTYAFRAVANIDDIHLPGSVQAYSSYSFGNISKATSNRNRSLYIGGPGDPTQAIAINNESFRNNSADRYSTITVYYDGTQERLVVLQALMNDLINTCTADCNIYYEIA